MTTTPNFGMNPAAPSFSSTTDALASCTSPVMSPITMMRSPTEIPSRFVDPTWSPAKTAYNKPDVAFTSPPACIPSAAVVPKLDKKSRKLPSYMDVSDSSVRELVYGVSKTVEVHIDEFFDVKEQIYSVESNEFYRFYLDSDIDSIGSVSDNIVITSKKQLHDIYKITKVFAELLCKKVEKLIEDARASLYDMPVHRNEWVDFAKDVATMLISAIDAEMETLEMVDIVV